MSNYSFIKDFTNIKVSSICKKLGINGSNVSSGSMSDENYAKIRIEIIKELLDLLIEDMGRDAILVLLYSELLEKVEKENKTLREMI